MEEAEHRRGLEYVASGCAEWNRSCTFSKIRFLQDFGFNILRKQNSVAGGTLSGPDEHTPNMVVSGVNAKKEYLNLSAGLDGFCAHETGREYSRIVQNQTIARPNIPVKVGKFVVAKVCRALDTTSIRDAPRCVGGSCAMSFRAFVIKIGDQQPSPVYKFSHRVRTILESRRPIAKVEVVSMRILGIESSCDETAAAVVQDGSIFYRPWWLRKWIHTGNMAEWYLELASREHLRAIVPVVRQALEQAQTDHGRTRCNRGDFRSRAGGLSPGWRHLREGACALRRVPLIAVNHVEGHIHAVVLEERQRGIEVRFPALAWS